MLDGETVVRVLLADGWHDVGKGTFSVKTGLADQEKPNGDVAEVDLGMWFEFRDKEMDLWLSGPLSSILAVADA